MTYHATPFSSVGGQNGCWSTYRPTIDRPPWRLCAPLSVPFAANGSRWWVFDDVAVGYASRDLAAMTQCDRLSPHEFGIELMAPKITTSGVMWGYLGYSGANAYFMELYTSAETAPTASYTGGVGIVNATIAAKWETSYRGYAPMINIAARVNLTAYDDDVGNQLARYCRSTTSVWVGVYAGANITASRLSEVYRGLNACTTS